MYYTKTYKMKYLFSFLLVFVCTYVYAQDPVYVQMKSNYLYKGIKMDSLFVLPNLDTANAREVTGAIVRMGTVYYWYNGAAWVSLTGAGGSTDTTSLSNRINDKIDSLRRVGVQVSFKKNGTWYSAYTDSLGGQNGRWGNDTATVILAKVRNSTASTLTRGTVVMLKGATGDVASVIRANNKADSTSARTIGIVKDPINVGDTGWIYTQGQASKLNTGSFAEGDVLYLDSLDGGLTNVKPQAPYHNVFIGIVERSNNGNGLIYVKPQNGYELDEIHDVRITSPLNNQILVYSDTQDLWKNRNVYSVVDTVGLSNRINTKLNASDTASLSNRIAAILITDINVFPPLTTSGGSVPYIGIDQANAVTDGYLSAVDWNYFDAKLTASDTTNMLKNYQRTSSFAVVTFGGGSAVAGDTASFSTSSIYGSFYNDGVDTIILTGYRAIVQGTSASITPTIYYNDTLSTGFATKVVNSPSAVTSTTTGNSVTSLDNTKIAPGNWVWVQTGTVTTKPTYFSLTLFGYRKR